MTFSPKTSAAVHNTIFFRSSNGVNEITGESKVSGQNVYSFLVRLKAFPTSQNLCVRTAMMCSF